MGKAEFVFEQDVPASSMAEAMSKAIRWVEAAGGELRDLQLPDYIRVEHGQARGARGWERVAPKFIDLRFSKQETGVHIQATFTPGIGCEGDAESDPERVRAAYAEVVNDLWSRFIPSRARPRAWAPKKASDAPTVAVPPAVVVPVASPTVAEEVPVARPEPSPAPAQAKPVSPPAAPPSAAPEVPPAPPAPVVEAAKPAVAPAETAPAAPEAPAFSAAPPAREPVPPAAEVESAAPSAEAERAAPAEKAPIAAPAESAPEPPALEVEEVTEREPTHAAPAVTADSLYLAERRLHNARFAIFAGGALTLLGLVVAGMGLFPFGSIQSTILLVPWLILLGIGAYLYATGTAAVRRAGPSSHST